MSNIASTYPGSRHPFFRSMGLFAAGLCLLLFLAPVHAASPITSSGLNTQVSDPIALPNGGTQYNITGGYRPGGGVNLYHGFGEFGAPANNIANFLNDTGMATTNILGRVTGGNPSNIFGTIQTEGFLNANLFLMNPAGIVFGPNATLNVAGSAHFTTADYIRLSDGGRFNAAPNPAADALLTAAPVAAFGFLGPNAASIAIQGSQLQVPEGGTVSLIGGNRTFQTESGDIVPSGVTVIGGTLSAPSGTIQIASVDSTGEVAVRTPQGADTFSTSGFATLGLVELSGETLLTVTTALDPDFIPLSEQGNGAVRIRAGQLVMDTATIDALNFGTLDGQPTAVDIDVRGDAHLRNAFIQAITIDAAGGEILIKAGTLDAEANVTTGTFGAGAGGNISVTTVGSLSLGMSSIEATTDGGGPGGSITLMSTGGSVTIGEGATVRALGSGQGNGGNVTIQGSQNVSIMNGGLVATQGGIEGTAGNIAITAGKDLKISSASNSLTDVIITRADGNAVSKAGDISLVGKNIMVEHNALIANSANEAQPGNTIMAAGESITLSGGSRIQLSIKGQAGGRIDMRAPTIAMDGASVRTRTAGAGDAGNIVVNGTNVSLRNSQVTADSVGSGRGGAVIITTQDAITVAGQFTDESGNVSPGGVFSQAFRNGHGGAVELTARSIDVSDAAQIATNTFQSGDAGTILLKTDHLTLRSGGRLSGGSLVPTPPTGLPSGAAGNITVQGLASPAQSVTITGLGSGLFTETQGTGAGGNITVDAGSFVLSNNGTVSAKTSGTASTATGGVIALNADQIQLNSGGTISASSTGPGKAGNILIEGTASPAESIRIDGTGSGLFTETSGTGAGGDITTWSEQLRLTDNATISAKTTGQMPNAGDAGDILIKADDITISGGATITAASTGTGDAGTVTIQGTNSPAQSVLITGAGSGVFSDTSGTGSGGDLLVISETVRLADGGTLSAATSGADASAIGGTIGILADNVRIENGVLTASSTGQGEGGAIGVLVAQRFESSGGTISTAAALADAGDIGLLAGESVTLTNGTSISTRSTGPGHAGDIFIDAGQRFEMINSSITAQAAEAAGGSIDIRALDRVKLVGSLISTSVLGGEGSGGNIFIDPNLTTLQASQILAQAVLGNGGNITLVTRLFFADPFSRIDASSQFGRSGSINIQSPTSDLAGTVSSLPSSMRQAQSLQTGRCAALANSQSSSFLIAGRDAIPTEPGGWQPSPFDLVGDGTGLAGRGDGQERLMTFPLMAMAEDVVSLRRLTPAGFLTQSFAESGSTGCHS